MSLAPRLVGLIAIALVAVLGASFVLSQEVDEVIRKVGHETHKAHKATRLALFAQVHFKKQVQEWKNILLRGADDADLAKYTRQFKAEERAVQEATEALLAVLPVESEAGRAALSFQAEHRLLATRYEAGLRKFVDDRKDPFRVDRSVRGIDREPTALLDDVVAGVGLWRDDRLVQVNGQLTQARRRAYVVQASVVTVALLVLLWALRSWVYQPVQRGIELAERISRGDLDTSLDLRHAPGELGRLLDALQKMQDSLQQTKREKEAHLAATQRAQRLAEEARNQAQADERAKAQFLANVSHELNTPLNGIIGSLMLLREEIDPRQRGDLEAALQCSDRLLVLVNDTLTYAELDTGRTELASAVFAPADLMSGLEREFDNPSRAKGLQLSFEISDDVPVHAVGDAEKITRVMHNLVDNALRFTEAGFVAVRMSRASRFDHGLRVEVQDSGVGIPAAQHRRIFERFTQVDMSNTRRHEGLGLGLALCRGHVRLMGGEMELKSIPDRGSTFAFEIPLGLTTPPPGSTEALVV